MEEQKEIKKENCPCYGCKHHTEIEVNTEAIKGFKGTPNGPACTMNYCDVIKGFLIDTLDKKGRIIGIPDVAECEWFDMKDPVLQEEVPTLDVSTAPAGLLMHVEGTVSTEDLVTVSDFVECKDCGLTVHKDRICENCSKQIE